MGLKNLKIDSFAIIDHLVVDFSDGFSVITGETGAGKSIIIDALNLALGEKAASTMIRSGSNSAIVECSFTDINSGHPVNSFLKSNGIELDSGKIVLKREVNINGRSKAWINTIPCPINVLKSAGDLLVDLHGQHDHQSLLHDDKHIDFLDAYGEYDNLLNNVSTAYHELSHLIEKYTVLVEKRSLNRERRELWEFQLKEIENVNPGENEYDSLLKEKTLLDNAEKIHTLSEELTNSLYEADEDTLYQRVLEITRKLGALNQIDPEFSDELARFEEIKFTIQELSRHLTDFNQNLQFDPGRAEIVNHRLFDIKQLMKKYGADIPEVLSYKKKIEHNLAEDDGLDKEIQDIEIKINDARKQYSEIAAQLSDARKKTARDFENEIVNVLAKLGIKDSRFEISIKSIESAQGWAVCNGKRVRCDAFGIDNVIFNISTNPGEPLRPLANIVSGGEVSRIMLAMKSIMAGKDHIPVVIFDEIDTGISGKVARIVGEQLKALSGVHQVICITHLPQIAGLGDNHYRVYKESRDGRSNTRIVLLDKDKRVTEIASLIGGSTITDVTRRQALELIGH